MTWWVVSEKEGKVFDFGYLIHGKMRRAVIHCLRCSALLS